MTNSPSQHRLIWYVSLLASVAAHAALLVLLLRGDVDTSAGAAGQELDVISVTLISPGALELREQEVTKVITPAPAETVELNDGSSDVDRKDAKREDQNTEKAPQEKPPPADAALEPRPEKRKQPEEQTSTAAGGAASRGDSVTERKSSAPAAASVGAIREYARSVHQALGKTKPKGLGTRGTVKVKFTIASTGRLSSLEIAKSSGNNMLDRNALDAVRRALFPVPPAGMSPAHLTYEIPYQFR